MDIILLVAGSAGIISVFPILLRLRRALRGTTLVNAWRWLLGCALLWTIAWLISLPFSQIAPELIDQVWYAVAVAMLCPLVGVLGARNPGSRVWTWFVVVPMLLVLGLPALTAWDDGSPVSRLILESPPTLGFLLVMVMGIGNYFGTRFTTSALLLCLALLLLITPLSVAMPKFGLTPERGRLWATLAASTAAFLAVRQARYQEKLNEPFNRLWLDFRDSFGIVWAKRIQDRINQTAEREQWPVRLEMYGLVHRGEKNGLIADTSEQVEQTFRWLLRRFVEPEWIDARLKDA